MARESEVDWVCLSGEAVGLIACCGVVVCAVSISRVLWAGPITWRYRPSFTNHEWLVSWACNFVLKICFV